jgi:hypothetical protein
MVTKSKSLRVNPRQLETFPERVLTYILIELPLPEAVRLGQTCRRLRRFSKNWDAWAIKAKQNFDIDRSHFNETHLENPAERYWQISMAHQFIPIHQSVSKPAPLIITYPYRPIRPPALQSLNRFRQLDRPTSPDDVDTTISICDDISLQSSPASPADVEPPTAEPSTGEPPNEGLYRAALAGNLGQVIYWLDQGATHISEALIVAAQRGHLSVVKCLRDRGCIGIELALLESAKGGHWNVAKYLIEHGATAIEEPLCSAAAQGRLDMVTYLVDRGAWSLSRAIHAAETNRHLDVGLYLRQRRGY